MKWAPLGLLVAGAALAEVDYTVPPGWRKVDRPEATTFVPPDMPAGKSVALVIYSTQPLRGDLASWGVNLWSNFQKTWRIEKGGPFVPGLTPHGDEMVTAEAWVTAPNNPSVRFYNWMIGVRIGREVASFQFITNAFDLKERHQQAVRDFLATVSGASQGRPAPSSQGSTPGDMYVALVESKSFDAATYRTHIDVKLNYFVVFPDGRFFAKLPDEGLEGFDYSAARQSMPYFCGRYTDAQIIYDDDRHTTMTFRKSGNQLTVGGKGPYHHLDRCDGLALEGTYLRSDWQTVPGGQNKLIAFTRDGRFEEHGALELASDLKADPVGGRGKYSIGNYSLTLSFDNGKRERINFHLEDGASRDDVAAFRMNTWKFIRVR